MSRKSSEIYNLEQLIGQYGDRKISDIVAELKGEKIHTCPKCKGRGYITEEYNGYPSGLPDSGWVYEPAYRDIKCNLCNGIGYTEHEYKPKMEQTGWV